MTIFTCVECPGGATPIGSDEARLAHRLATGHRPVPQVGSPLEAPRPTGFQTVANGFGGTTTVRLPAFTRGAAGASGNLATDKQKGFLRTLLGERSGNPAAEAIRDGLNQARTSGGVTRAQASAAIEALKAIARTEPSAPAAPAPRVNQYPGKCDECGTTVEPGEGTVTKADDGKWVVSHTTCPASDFPFPLGSYAIDNADGDVRFYLASLDGLFVLASDNLHRVHPSAQEAVIEAIAADPEGASRRYGQEWQVCGRCGRGLTDTTPGGSRDQGIGPVCARKGWD